MKWSGTFSIYQNERPDPIPGRLFLRFHAHVPRDDPYEDAPHVVHEGIDERDEKKGQECGEKEPAHHGDAQGGVRDADEVDIAEGHGDEPENRREGRHHDGAEAVFSRLDNRVHAAQALGSQPVYEVQQDDGVIHNDARENHDADIGHDGEFRACNP